MTATEWNIDPDRIDRNWRAVTVELDAPRAGRIERMLRAFGLPAHLTRVMVATPGLRRAWFVATALAVFVAMAPFDGTETRADLFTLLLVAPLVPVLGVSFSYGVESDPAHEASIATPIRGLRLLLTRSAVIVSTSTAALAVAALIAPGAQPMAFAWLIPTLGLTTAMIALMTFVAPRQAAVLSSSAWILGIAVVRAADLAAFTGPGQLVMIAVTVVALATTWVRREHFDRLEVRL